MRIGRCDARADLRHGLGGGEQRSGGVDEDGLVRDAAVDGAAVVVVLPRPHRLPARGPGGRRRRGRRHQTPLATGKRGPERGRRRAQRRHCCRGGRGGGERARRGWWWWVPATACGARCVCVCQELVGTCQVVAVYRCARGTDGCLAPFGFARFGNSGVLIVSINVYLQSNKIRLNFFDKFKRIGNLESGTNKIPLLKHGIPIPNSRPCFILINKYGLGIWNRKPTKQSALVQINSSPSVDKLDAHSASRPSLCSGIP
jgi:hypothetical protein